MLVEMLQDRNSKKGRKVDGVFPEGNGAGIGVLANLKLK